MQKLALRSHGYFTRWTKLCTKQTKIVIHKNILPFDFLYIFYYDFVVMLRPSLTLLKPNMWLLWFSIALIAVLPVLCVGSCRLSPRSELKKRTILTASYLQTGMEVSKLSTGLAMTNTWRHDFSILWGRGMEAPNYREFNHTKKGRQHHVLSSGVLQPETIW